MVKGPVKRKKQKITSPYGGRGTGFHRGVDLRCVNFTNWIQQPFVATEDSTVVRVKRDANDNGIIVLRPDYSDYDEIKYIHVNIDQWYVRKGDRVKEGDIIGYSEIRGQSKAHHLHYEVWKGKKHIDPVKYFDQIGIDYD